MVLAAAGRKDFGGGEGGCRFSGKEARVCCSPRPYRKIADLSSKVQLKDNTQRFLETHGVNLCSDPALNDDELLYPQIRQF